MVYRGKVWLREKGYDAEHIIALGQRGIPDSVLRQRLAAEELVFGRLLGIGVKKFEVRARKRDPGKFRL